LKRKPDSFFAFLSESFVDTFNTIGVVAGVIGVILALYVVPSGSKWAVKPIFVGILIIGYVFVILLNAAHRAYNKDTPEWPRVRNVLLAQSLGTDPGILLLVDPFGMFVQNALVSVHRAGEAEELVAVGKIVSIQEDGRIQVRLFLPTGITDKELENQRMEFAAYAANLKVKSIILPEHINHIIERQYELEVG